MKQSGFDRIACIYDSLAWIFFGNKIRLAQLHHLHLVKTNDEVLILGGGTGWIALEILNAIPSARITFVDSSKRMIELARKKTKGHVVDFIHGTEESVTKRNFDVILTPFYLDLFPQKKLEQVVSSLITQLRSGGFWIATDFVNESWWHKIYLSVMYKFFRITCSIEASRLPIWRNALVREGLALEDEARFYKGFIAAQVWRRER